jgi:hypothetical protein
MVLAYVLIIALELARLEQALAEAEQPCPPRRRTGKQESDPGGAGARDDRERK